MLFQTWFFCSVNYLSFLHILPGLQRRCCCADYGYWTEWVDAGDCDRTCGYGQIRRTRDCVPEANYAYPDCPVYCDGPSYKYDDCVEDPCCPRKR